MEWMLPSVWIDRIAASAKSDALVSRTKGKSGSQCLSSSVSYSENLTIM